MKKIFTFAAAILASAAMMAQDPAIALTAKTSEIADWNKTYDNVTISVQGAALASKKPCGVTVNENAMSISSSDSYWIEISCEAGLSKLVLTGSANTSGTANYAAPLCVCANAPFDSTITQIIEVYYTGYDQECVENEIPLPEGTKSVRLYRRMKVNAEVNKVGTGSNWTPATATGNQTYNITYLEAYSNAAPSTDPVTAAVISGETACAVGGSVELTCTAAKATTYQWYVGGAAIDGATAKKYTFAPTAAGEFSFTCAASNEYTPTPVVSAAHVVSVTDPASACGELIKATHTGGKTATVTGVLGGTADKNTANDGKFGGKGQYFGITLASGAFMAGDELNVHTTTAAGQGTIAIYADKNGETMLYNSETMGVLGDNILVLPAALNNANTLYICRTNANTWNGYVDYISVTRSCEASSNAEIASLTINGEAVEAVEGVYSYTVGASVDLAAVEVVYTLAHPLATATPASGFTVNVPAAGAAANSKQIVVTAQDGTTTKTYTVSVTKSAQASHDATLSALTVAGYTLDPAFASDTYAYTITKAYGAANPEVSAINAAPNDANAVALISYANDVFTITVTAEDKTTTLDYTIHILEAAAKKALLEAAFSNGVHGFIANGNIDVPYLAGETEPTFVAAKFWDPDGDPSAAVVDGKLVVTGIDGKQDQYTITYKPLTPMTASYDTITFTEVPSYIYSVYGWDAERGVKFSKDVEEATNHRISEGKDRIYIALPVASAVTLISGSANSRPVTITVNGEVSEITKTAKSNDGITIPLVAKTGANFVGIESNGNSGDAGFIKIQLIEGIPTAIENTEVEMKAMKIVRDGQLFILKNGVLYNMQGAIVK